MWNEKHKGSVVLKFPFHVANILLQLMCVWGYVETKSLSN